MTPTQYKKALDQLHLSQLAAGRLFGKKPRTAQCYAIGELAVPKAIELLLLVMLEYRITPEQLEQLKKR